MMLGSIPQQDVFQRVMSANSVKAATRGPVIGGVCYILFAFVPMFLVASALIIMPEQADDAAQGRSQKVLPTLVLEKMPFVMQVLFFGALLSAIKSHRLGHAAGASRSPSPRTSGASSARASATSRTCGPCASRCWCSAPACWPTPSRMQGTPIYELVSGAYQVTLVGAFVPLVCGLYWKRATTQGAIFSIVLGIADLAAVPGHAAGRGVPGPAGRPAGGLGRHGGRLARRRRRIAQPPRHAPPASAGVGLTRRAAVLRGAPALDGCGRPPAYNCGFCTHRL